MDKIKEAYSVCQGGQGAGKTTFSREHTSVPIRESIVDEKFKSQAFDKLKGYKPEEVRLPNSKWHKRFLNLALHVSTWSKDPSTECGSVIVDDKQRIVSLGYNGFPRNVDDTPERLDDRELKYELTIHAEMNAMMFANAPLEGMTLYVTPMAPCIRCAVHIVQTGITTVVFPKLPPKLEERWGKSVEMSKSILTEAFVKWIEI